MFAELLRANADLLFLCIGSALTLYFSVSRPMPIVVTSFHKKSRNTRVCSKLSVNKIQGHDYCLH